MSIFVYMFKSKKREEVEAKAKKEGEKIFMKLNPKMAMKDGTFPKAGPTMPNAYNKEATRVEKQVVDTRVKQFKKENESPLIKKLKKYW